MIGGKQVDPGWTAADVERLTQGAVNDVVAKLGLAAAGHEATQGVGRLVDTVVRAFEDTMTRDQSAASSVAGYEAGWKAAIGIARDLVALKLNELPENAKPAERALLQVFDALAKAETMGYKPPEKLDRYKTRRSRPQVRAREPSTIREFILAALPKVGKKAKRADIKSLVIDWRGTTSASGVDNVIVKLVREGELDVLPRRGGDLLMRTRPPRASK
ncbi:hypothetical protein SRS16CHR_03590 [Variovorax sp. SRS16]|uniref:hypothetical protein n=1 Tax=Variovorax sp. SRS16 TaxID=282217 RepID=UPI001319B629|nr:hypothetical protein [Variovorax sp. SRS16]VTU25089.1 hypothetical protein SRS16CHR_03590 [Variovorax sp. SRS16]